MMQPGADMSSCAVQSRVQGHLLLDPTADEAYQEDGHLLLAYMPQANLVCPGSA